jgi:oligogalacturonide lyase
MPPQIRPNTPPPLVSSSGMHCQLLYFTSTSLTADGKTIVFIGDDGQSHNLYAFDCATQAITKLTQCQGGYLRSYVYFDGRPYEGFGKASVSLDADNGLVYFIDGRHLKVVDLMGRTKTLATLPGDEITAFTHVSADGRLICIPTVDKRAFASDELGKKEFQNLSANPSTTIDRRVQDEGLSSYLNVFDTETGRLTKRETVERAWITHVQFSPLDSNLILYNHEWPVADCGIRRMWMWDGKSHIRMRSEGEGRSRGDWTCHEMWARDGKTIIYHGTYAADGRPYVGRINPDGSERVEVSLPDGWTRYGHFTVGSGEGELVTDGHYVADAADTDPVCPWVCRVGVDWSARTLAWQPLARAASSWSSQDSHPHPIFDHASESVLFTSDVRGRREIFRVPVR